MKLRNLLWGLIILLLAFPVNAAEDYIIDGDEIDWDVINEIVEARGNVVITGPDLQITADYAKFKIDKEELFVEGSCRLEQQGLFVQGDQMEINLGKETLWVQGSVEGSYEQWEMQGEELSLAGDRTGDLTGPGWIKREGFYLEGNNFSLDLAGDTLIAEEEAHLEYEELKIWADRIEFRDEEFVLFVGNVNGNYKRMRIEGQKVRYILPPGEERVIMEKGRIFLPAGED